MQKALIVSNRGASLDELNKHLEDGWSIVMANPMGGAGGGAGAGGGTSVFCETKIDLAFSSLVIIEKEVTLDELKKYNKQLSNKKR